MNPPDQPFRLAAPARPKGVSGPSQLRAAPAALTALQRSSEYSDSLENLSAAARKVVEAIDKTYDVDEREFLIKSST